MAGRRWVNYGKSFVAGVSLCVSCSVMAGGHQLYERIGAQDGIATVVDGFLGKVGADDRVNGRFANTDMLLFLAFSRGMSTGIAELLPRRIAWDD